jgi:hypothetical protein
VLEKLISQRNLFFCMSDTPAPEPKAEFVPTPATTIDEMLKAAYFVASGIDAPVVEVVDNHRINLHYPADGSLATVRIEARPGAWGGIGIHGTPEDEDARNAHYDEMKAAAEAPPPVEEPAEVQH